MDQADIEPLLGDLSGDIDSLTRSLKPLLDTPLPTTASKLPLLDKAKLHVLTTYAIESLLFSSLRLSGVDAKEHPVFRELTRTRQYFEKIKKAEEGPQKRAVEVDKAAAGRFIKAGLAGNEELDRQRAAEQERRQASGKRKLDGLNTGSAEAPEVGRAAMLAKRGKWMTVEDTAENIAAETLPGVTDTSGEPQASLAGDVGEQTQARKHRTPKRSRKHKHKSDKPPKSGREAFQALMQGPKEHG